MKSINGLKFSSLIFEQRCILVYFYGLVYVGDKNILFVCMLFIYFKFLLYFYGKIIGNIFELRSFLYLIMINYSPNFGWI